MSLIIKIKENRDHTRLHLERQSLNYQEAISTSWKWRWKNILSLVVSCCTLWLLAACSAELRNLSNAFPVVMEWFWMSDLLLLCQANILFWKRLHKNDTVYQLNAKLRITDSVFSGSLSLDLNFFISHLSYTYDQKWKKTKHKKTAPTNISSAYILNSIHYISCSFKGPQNESGVMICLGKW